MFYNAENLFDTFNDTTKDDDEFLPGGVMRWNMARYRKKISSIYKAIVAAGEWSPPAIVAFSEIENRKVLEDLVYGTYLSGFNYGIVHDESPDPRGIDVCLVYRKDIVEVLGYRSMIPDKIAAGEFHSRSVLCVKCRIAGDTLHLLVNHWPSRRGGVLAGADLRGRISWMVRSAADSIDRSCNNHAKIMIMGDFNSGPDDEVILTLTGSAGKSGDGSHVRLVNLADGKAGSPGTYRYQGTWETLDQVIVSEWLMKCGEGLFADKNSFKVFRPSFLLTNDPKYPGQTPFSTYKGYKYQGGFSDHLPVTVDLFSR